MASTLPPPLPREFLETPKNEQNGPDLSIIIEQVRVLVAQEALGLQGENKTPDRNIRVAG